MNEETRSAILDGVKSTFEGKTKEEAIAMSEKQYQVLKDMKLDFELSTLRLKLFKENTTPAMIQFEFEKNKDYQAVMAKVNLRKLEMAITEGAEETIKDAEEEREIILGFIKENY